MSRGTSTDVNWSVGAYRKLPRIFFPCSESWWGIALAYRRQPAVVLPWGWASIWEEVSRRIRLWRWGLDLHIYSTGFSDCRTQREIPKASVENEKKGSVELPLEKLRGLTVMAPRHIYNPTILRGRGRFPVPLSSCDIALLGREAALLVNTTMFTGKSGTLTQRSWRGVSTWWFSNQLACIPNTVLIYQTELLNCNETATMQDWIW